MLHKLPLNIFNNLSKCIKLSARHSALFINGEKAIDTFAYIVPHIDFPKQIERKGDIQKLLNRRKVDIDLEKIENNWIMYEELKNYKTDLDNKRQELSNELGKLLKDKAENIDDINKYKLQINEVKENLKKLKTPLWSAEETAFMQALALPNILHPLTPDDNNKIIYEHSKPPSCKKNHLQVARNLNLINFTKNENYYLKGDAAIFEFGAKFYFSNLLKKYNFVQFSNPDFVKSVIVEGCFKDHRNPKQTYILHHNENSKVNMDNRLHLTGGSSLYSFFAYHAKNVVYPKVFPLRYFTTGHQYLPSLLADKSLFNVSQYSAVELFEAAKDERECDTMLTEIIDILKAAYTQFGYHFRMSIVPAEKLSLWESLRVSIEMFSTFLNNYIEIANISVSGDFISKRLVFSYVDNNETKFPHVITGTVLNVPKFLGCVLEQDGDFSVPVLFKKDQWST